MANPTNGVTILSWDASAAPMTTLTVDFVLEQSLITDTTPDTDPEEECSASVRVESQLSISDTYVFSRVPYSPAGPGEGEFMVVTGHIHPKSASHVIPHIITETLLSPIFTAIRTRTVSYARVGPPPEEGDCDPLPATVVTTEDVDYYFGVQITVNQLTGILSVLPQVYVSTVGPYVAYGTPLIVDSTIADKAINPFTLKYGAAIDFGGVAESHLTTPPASPPTSFVSGEDSFRLTLTAS